MIRNRVLVGAACLSASVTAVALHAQGQSQAPSQAPKLVRSLAGPSGKVVGPEFVLDETRNRFVFPQDRSLTVYFEWEAPAGDHALTATWKAPDGRVVSVSDDVKIHTFDNHLNSYWMFPISQGLAPGAWTVEVRIDGQPAGTHTFELAGVDGSSERFTLDRVVKTFGPSVVRVSKLDDAGHRFDSGTGFVIAPNAIATAFQSIDMASTLEIEFADGHRVQASEVLALSRLGDWAVIKADTGNSAPLPRGDAQSIPAGSRLAVFNVDAGTRVIMPVDVGAVSAPQGYSTRIKFAPSAALEAMGGPVFDERGAVVGILGGSLTPGSRQDSRLLRVNSVWSLSAAGNSATFIADVPLTIPASGKTLADLKVSGMLTPAVTPMTELAYGGITTELPKTATIRSIPLVTEVSSRDDVTVSVYGFWFKTGKLSKGEIGGQIFDAMNQPRGTFPPKKISLQDNEQRSAFSFSPKTLAPGYYRIDMTWDGKPVWRVYLHVTD